MLTLLAEFDWMRSLLERKRKRAKKT